jgi:Ca2+-binding RTX toxin-like protein
MAEGDTLINALVGGIASIVLSFVPLSPVLGGAIAGYLQGGTRNDGLRVGAYSGIVAAIPLALFFVFALALFGVVGIFSAGAGGGRAAGGIALFLFAFVFALVVSAIYTVGLGAIGGWLGNYVKYDTDLLE